MSHATLSELTDAVHGFAPVPLSFQAVLWQILTPML
jgi:hypothetical protein